MTDTDCLVIGAGPAGVAAAMISKKGCATRDLDIKALQRHLVKAEILPESILTETDNFPLPKEKVVVNAIGPDATIPST